jgi:hypothetical protein
MFKRIRTPTAYEFAESRGPIIATQQKTWTFTQESRTCCKCGLVDTRRVGEPVYEGWT